ncbi:MAG: hypothetical protein HY852_00545 [Bradyrhizobium sp.]|uniref:hypothetical protein n=1 Tax=Bradyrhizobium sp. TaxID=376 RepID=UPI0025BB8890|nr:hypothetical protein [Bradyrhizobium sp.]MBI5260290.1 hypothetical protein [Bradyrhizobium sp.]
MSAIDATKNALATIASILEPGSHREPEHPVTDQQPAANEPPLVPEPADADGYTKFGPGPMAAIRFKWTVQRGEDGEYYVHETIGEHSAPVVSGPMTGEAAVRFVDDRESEARQRFEALRTEIAGRAAVAELMRNDRGDV